MSHACKNIQRQLAVINVMFQDIGIQKEADYNDMARKRLQDKGLLIHQCPEFCDSTSVLAKCMIDGETAPECIVMGVNSGDFPMPETIQTH